MYLSTLLVAWQVVLFDNKYTQKGIKYDFHKTSDNDFESTVHEKLFFEFVIFYKKNLNINENMKFMLTNV